MLTEKDYCDYDTCVALNELGLSFEDASQRFERNILTNRYEEVPRPLLYEAQKWLREEKGFDRVIKPVDKCTTFIGGERYFSMLYRNQERVSSLDVPCTITFEESLLARIKEAVKLLKEEKQYEICQNQKEK